MSRTAPPSTTERPMQRPTIQVEERVPLLSAIPLSYQHLFAMIGASVVLFAIGVLWLRAVVRVAF